MTNPDMFLIILLYNLYISTAVQSKMQTDYFVKIRLKKKKKETIVIVKSIFKHIIRLFAQQRQRKCKRSYTHFNHYFHINPI